MQPADASIPTEPTEIVQRPAPGTLARGAWEAPAWAFYAAAGLVLLAAALYAAARLGLVKRRARSGAPKR